MNEYAATLDRAPRLHTLVLPVSGRRLSLRAGDILEIQMRQITGSGSEWSVTSAFHGVEFVRDEHFPGQRGSFTTRLFGFRAVAAGAGLLRLAIGRPELADPLGHVDLHVTVLA